MHLETRMPAKLPDGLVPNLLAAIQESHEEGTRFFYPQQFSQLASIEDVTTGLSTLVSSQFLHVEAVIRCDEGHDMWIGDPAEVEAVFDKDIECDECGAEPFGIALQFNLTPQGEAFGSQKKKTMG